MLMSQVDSLRSENIKKGFYIPGQDEYSCSSETLNGLVLSEVIDAMPSYHSTCKGLKKGYIADLVREGGISPCSLLLGLVYVRRLAASNKEYISTISPRELFLVAMVVASKYMNDEGEMEALTNSEWAAIGSTSKRTLDNLERDFLQAIRWELYVPLKEFYEFVASAEGSVAMNQACQRGWCSYSELTAIWTSSQFQEYMLKYTTKVAFTGASLYLVCVSTLLAASHSLSTLAPEATTAPLQPDATPTGPLPSFSLADLISTSPTPPASWEEAWPGGSRRGVSETTPPFLSPNDSLSKLLLSPSTPQPLAPEKWLHVLLGSPCGSYHNLHNTTYTGLQDQLQDRLQDRLQDTGTGLQDMRVNELRPAGSGDGGDYWNGSTAERNNLPLSATPSTSHSTPPITSTPHSSHLIVSTPHLRSPLLLSQNLVTEATVDSLQAEDLGFHQRGTFHWNPLINSSANITRGGGPWSTIVKYFIPSQWTI